MKGLIRRFGLVCTSVFLLGLSASPEQPCNSYRLGYESAITQGMIKRAPLVSGPKDAYTHFTTALKNGDRINAAVRAVQYLVIVSESSSPDTADLERLEIENAIVNHYQKPVEVAVPMLAVILPPELFCPAPASSSTP